jgi:undecaprenyl-diphosphatase
MTILHSIILGIVEGITEFLPISSTGHMVLVSELLGISKETFTKSFEIIIQLGAILAVVVLYWNKLIKNKHLIYKLLIAFIPTAIIGLGIYKYIKELLGSVYVVISALFVGGIILMYFEKWATNFIKKRNITVTDEVNNISVKQSIYIGLFQSIAMIPGVSRSGATIVGGAFLGISRKAIVEFSFLLAIPTMCSATFLDIYKNKASFSYDQLHLLTVGFTVSFVVALLAVKSFLKYIEKNSFKAFGIYRICLALVYVVYLLSVMR